ncbi:signal peptidase I [Caulobacter mirabilis]|nr:signal peptidase I [Caulobacter mirabilis]
MGLAGVVVVVGIAAATVGVVNASRSYSYGGTAMLPTMAPGDVFYVEPLDEVRRGDFVTFRAPSADVLMAMRVIGLPGDRIRLEDGRLTVSGQAAQQVGEGEGPRSVCADSGRPPRRIRETLPGGASYLTYDCGPRDLDNMAELIVPSGRYFLLGDNRDNALDSRPPEAEGGFGFVPSGNLVGLVRSGRPPIFKRMMRSFSRNEADLTREQTAAIVASPGQGPTQITTKEGAPK